MTKMTLSEVIKKLKSKDPTFTKLDLQDVDFVRELNDGTLSKLAAAIKANRILKRFEFNRLYHTQGRDDWTHIGIEAIGNALKDHPTLEELHINSVLTGITPIERCAFLKALSGKAKIKKFYLTDYLSDAVLSSVGESLTGNTTLESITILPRDDVDEEYNDDALRTFASGFAGKSLQHLNLKLRLNDASIEILSQHLSKTHTLKTMVLNRCNITPIGMTFITNILNKNPDLTLIDLSNNPLDSSSIKSLASALPNLPQLKTLSLHNTNFDAQALGELAESWRKSDLKIHTLEICNAMDSAYNKDYIAAVKKIIENNKYLKKLDMGDKQFKIEHFYLLLNLLQDPNKCRLQQFVFGQFFGGENFNNVLINTLKKNHHLTKLIPHYISTSLTSAWRENVAIQKKSQQLFVEKVISFSNVYFSPSEDKEPQPSWIPRDIFLLILNQLGQETLGMNDEDVVQCTQLIFENFSTRRKLIDEKKYCPITEINSTSKLEFSKWWSLSSRGDNSKRIFQQRTVEDGKAEVNQATSESHTLQGNEAVYSKPVKSSTKCITM